MKKIHRLFPLLVSLAGLSGCSEEPCFGAGIVTGTMPPTMILVGAETAFHAMPSLPDFCRPEEVPTPTSLTVEVTDPDNQPVQHSARLGNPASTPGTIRFTASKPGRHHVFIAFEPVGGIQQRDFHAAMDHSKTATALAVPQQCSALERTRQGAFVCDQDVLRDRIYLRRFTDDSLLAVAGDAVWMVNGSSVERYVDSGSAFTLTQSLGDIHGAPEFLLATENELVVFYPYSIKLLTVSGTGLFHTGTALWTPSNIPLSTSKAQVVAVRTGDRLGVVTRIAAGSTIASTYQVCPHRLQSGRFDRTTEPCPTFTGTLVGYEPDGLWVANPQRFSQTEFTDLRYLQWTAAGLVEQASLPLDANLTLKTRPFDGRQTAVPTLTASTSPVGPLPISALAVYSADRRSILMEHLGRELFEGTASQRLYWSSRSSGPPSDGLPVLVRPSAP
jgi:hypothetical protein